MPNQREPSVATSLPKRRHTSNNSTGSKANAVESCDGRGDGYDRCSNESDAHSDGAGSDGVLDGCFENLLWRALHPVVSHGSKSYSLTERGLSETMRVNVDFDASLLEWCLGCEVDAVFA
jgi:hypothetical protein